MYHQNKVEAASKHFNDYNNYKEMANTLAKAWGLES